MTKFLKKTLKNNIVVITLFKLKQILPAQHRKKSLAMFLLLLLNSLFEMVGLAVFIPLFSIIVKPGIIHTNKVLSWMYNFGGFTAERPFIITFVGLIVLFVIAKNFASIWIVRSQTRFSFSLYQYFVNQLYGFYYSKGFPFFKKTNSNVILGNINYATVQFANGVVLSVLNFLNEIFVLLLILAGLMFYDAKVVIVLSISILPVFLLFYNWVKGRASKLEKDINALNPMLYQGIFQSVHGFVDVSITNTQERFKNRISKLVERMVDLYARRIMYNAAPTKVIESGMILTIFAIIVYGMYFLNTESLAALLGLFALAAYRILPSINRIMIALIGMKGNQFSIDVMSESIGYQKDDAKHTDLSFEDAIQINNLSFKFPDSPKNILSNVNLTIKKGDSLGLIGTSGSGKTTLINLLLGFWQPTSGAISVDNTPLSKDTLKSWRDHIGYVQQDVYIIDASIAENIAFGLEVEEIDMVKLEDALRKASLWDFVQSLPSKTSTNIGERGAKLSGGQRQRIGIARALYSGADILFFDEATSALDTETEHEITESIRMLADGKLTLIIIAHRKSTLKYCSHIVKIKNGVFEKEERNAQEFS